MPLPKPNKSETKQEFIDRCMADETMKKEYQDEKQRYAVCQSQWDKNEEKSAEGDIERRYFTIDAIEMRADDGKEKIKGHSAVFDKLSEDLGGFREKIKKGAFSRSIKAAAAGTKTEIKVLWNHNSDFPLASTYNGSLRLAEDDKGCPFDFDPMDTPVTNYFYEAIRTGVVHQMSFAFRAVKDEWDNSDPKNPVRTLIDVDLIEISPVSFPAYPQTSVKVRDYLNALSQNNQPGDQDAPEKGSADSLEILRRRQAFLEIEK